MSEPQQPLVIVELEQTCGACPSQWEGKCDDGRAVYIRYRHGCLSVGVGRDADAAVGNSMGWEGQTPFLYVEPDHDSDGWMTTEEMLRFTGFSLIHQGGERP